MAKDDPESSLAEDRATAKWSDGGFGPSTTLEGAFRAGFRAARIAGEELRTWERSALRVGLDSPGGMQQAKHMADAACEALGLEYLTTSPADIREAVAALKPAPGPEIPNGSVEALLALEAQIRILNDNQAAAEGRLRALEEHPERLGSSEKHLDQRVESLERMAFPYGKPSLVTRVEKLEARVGELDGRTVGCLRFGGG